MADKEYLGKDLYAEWVYSGGTVTLSGEQRNFTWQPNIDFIELQAGSDATRRRHEYIKDWTATVEWTAQSDGTALITALAEGTRGTLLLSDAGTAIVGPRVIAEGMSQGVVRNAPYSDIVMYSLSIIGDGAPTELFYDYDILFWQTESAYIHIAGKPEADWSHVTYVGDNNTYIIPALACRRNGTIDRIVCRAHAVTEAWTFRLYRWTGAVYEMVVGSERSITPTTGDVTSTIDLASPIDCQIGDIPGIYFPASNLLWEDVTSIILNKQYVAGDETSDAFASSNGGSFALACYGKRPYLAIAGDSIAAGNNAGAGNYWYPYTHNAPPEANGKSFPGGTYTSEVWRGVSDFIADNAGMSWQNASLSGEDFAYGVSTGVPNALAAEPHTLVVAFGTNDIIAGETWAATETRLDAIKVLFDASSAQKMVLCEILPRTGATDQQAANIRTFNANFATWCTTNGVTLALLHDAMGQTRGSTGEIDDLATAYDYDGVHLTTAGVAKYAELFLPYVT